MGLSIQARASLTRSAALETQLKQKELECSGINEEMERCLPALELRTYYVKTFGWKAECLKFDEAQLASSVPRLATSASQGISLISSTK